MVATVTLTATRGPMKGRQWVFHERTLLSVGRDPDCLLSLNECADLTVSRRHCLFDINPPYASIRDLGSLNGTYVNRQRLGGRDPFGQVMTDRPSRLPLLHGDLVSVGATCFELTTSQDRPDPESPALGEDRTEMPRFEKDEPGAEPIPNSIAGCSI